MLPCLQSHDLTIGDFARLFDYYATICADCDQSAIEASPLLRLRILYHREAQPADSWYLGSSWQRAMRIAVHNTNISS